jgi:hypothetical protein
VVTSRFSWDSLASEYAHPYRAWINTDPAVTQVLEEDVAPQPDYVYKIDGRLDPDACAGLAKG